MYTGQRVEVYRNLHRSRQQGEAVYSVRDVRSGLVVGHISNIALDDCEFRVSEAGRQRCLREKRKNVHAVIRGTIASHFRSGRFVPITYNPYKFSSFVTVNGLTPIFSAPYVEIEGKEVQAVFS